jgi:hypothetical protein
MKSVPLVPLVIAGLLAISIVTPTAAAAQGAPAPPQPADPEAEERPAAVLVSGTPVLWIMAGAGPYSTDFRAARISQRLSGIIRDRTIRDPTVAIVETDGSSELRVGSSLVMVITPRDAARLGVPRAALAQQYARIVEEAIRTERLRYAPATLLRSGVYGLVATVLFGIVVWIIVRIMGAIRRRLAAWRRGRKPCARCRRKCWRPTAWAARSRGESPRFASS